MALCYHGGIIISTQNWRNHEYRRCHSFSGWFAWLALLVWVLALVRAAQPERKESGHSSDRALIAVLSTLGQAWYGNPTAGRGQDNQAEAAADELEPGLHWIVPSLNRWSLISNQTYTMSAVSGGAGSG
jgi:hypothetical protein